MSNLLGLLQTALELGLISSLTVLALFLSYTMLNVCDLSTDGCFTLGAVVGAVVAISGSPVSLDTCRNGSGSDIGIYSGDTSDQDGNKQPPCRNHRQYRSLLDKYGSDGQFVPACHEQDGNSFFKDEGASRKLFSRKAIQAYRGFTGSDSGHHFPVTVFEDKAWTGDQSNR